jgi:macrolide transport system ATP-binding/permease protein
MESLWQDLRYGFRKLIKSPGFTLGVVLSLGLGIGANSTIFSLANTLLLRPLTGVEDSKRLVGVYNTQNGAGYLNISYRDYVYYREHNQVFSDLIAHWMMPFAMRTGADAAKVDGAIVSGSYFSVLGLKPVHGRFFLQEEDQTPGNSLVAVVSYRLWRQNFNSDPELVGKTISLNGHSFNIVGIAPEGFTGTMVGLSADIWVPTMTHDVLVPGPENLSKGNWYLMVMGRLKPGVSIDQTQATLSILASQLAETYQDTNKGRGVVVTDAIGTHPALHGTLAAFITILMVIVGLVLLIACTNVANLLLARAITRRKEIAIRLSLAGSRGRLIRQLLTESILLALLGGAVGILIARWVGNIIMALIPPMGIPLSLDMRPDIRVFMFTLLLSILTGIIFGLVPAWQSTNPVLALALRDDPGRSGYRKSRISNLLVIIQVMMSTLLLTCAGLFVRSLIKAQNASPGFDPKNILVMSFDPSLLGYDDAKTAAFYHDLLERVDGLPGVGSASLAEFIPLGSAGDDASIVIEGHEPPPEEKNLRVSYNLVTTDYFQTMGIPLMRGRPFNEQDRNGAPGALIINETMANRHWPNEEVVGKRLLINHQPFSVIGVAKDTKYRSLGEDSRPFIFVSFFQRDTAKIVSGDMKLHVRTNGDTHNVLAAIRREVQTLDPNQPVFDIQPLIEGMRFALIPTQVAGSVLGLSGLLALLLSAVGIYSLIAYSVGQRTREIGIRMALGAQRRDILKSILVQGLKLASKGVVIGLLASFALTRVIRSLLYGVSATDPATFIFMSLLLIFVAMLACFFPAYNAVRVDPIVALRYE